IDRSCSPELRLTNDGIIRTGILDSPAQGGRVHAPPVTGQRQPVRNALPLETSSDADLARRAQRAGEPTSGDGRTEVRVRGAEAQVQRGPPVVGVDLHLVRTVVGQLAAAQAAAQVTDVTLVAELGAADRGVGRVEGGEVVQRCDAGVGLPVVVAEEALVVALE